jgi:small ligand-binding sensory domain FIST
VAGSGVGVDPDWPSALHAALDQALAPMSGQSPDLLLLFAADAFHGAFPDLLHEAAERSDAREMAGCSGWGVIGADRELEAEPAVAALALRFPAGAFVSVAHVRQADIEGPLKEAGGWAARLGLKPAACTGLVILADPFSMDISALLAGLTREYPGVPTVGGLASGNPGGRLTHVFSGTHSMRDGAVLVALGGSVALRAVVSQGCEPIGQPWTITDAHAHVLRSIGNRPAVEVLFETLQAMSETERTRAARNLLVGLAMDEYRDEFKRGDFLIRNLMGADQSSGALAVGAHLQVGHTLQFQVRDARAADEELRQLLTEAASDLSHPPEAAVLFACNGRGRGLFGRPDHDVSLTRELLHNPAVAGFFCNGEIGPVGKSTYLHGFTASLGLFVPSQDAAT